MEWVRFSTSLSDDPRMDGLTVSAKWHLFELWCHAGRWETDGFVKGERVKARHAEALLGAGLLRRVRGGFELEDYLEIGNPTKARLQEKRALGKERIARFRNEESNAGSNALQLTREVEVIQNLRTLHEEETGVVPLRGGDEAA